MPQRLMKKFSELLARRMEEAKKTEHDAEQMYQHSESNAKMVQAADEKSLVRKKQAKFTLESQLMDHKRKRVQLAEDQRNIDLRLRQLHHDCDVIFHSIDSSIEDSIRARTTAPTK